jgi:cytochrome c-type biogenesis protein CcmH
VRALAFALLLGISGAALAQSAEIAHPDPATEARLKGLAEELRCLVCQNQTIADSSAPLALDLRNQIRVQIAQGRTDDQIRDYMVQRYGDFVLYKPPFKATTAILWLAPFLLIVAGAIALFRIVRRRRTEASLAPAVPEKSRREIEKLLDG